MLFDNSNKSISLEEECWEDDNIKETTNVKNDHNYVKTGNSKITIKKDSKQSIKSLVNKLFNKNDYKILSKDEQIDTLMKMYQDLESQNKELRDNQDKTERQKQREFIMNNDYSNKPIINGMSKSTISDEENRIVKSWQTREALNKSEKNSINGRSKSPVFWKTPNVDTKKIWKKPKNSRSRSHSRSPSAAYRIKDKNKLKAVRKASENALFNFKGRTDEILQTWINTMERYFKFFELNEEDEMDIAIFYLKDQALQKYVCSPNRDNLTWNDLKNVLTQSFKSMDYQFALRTKITKMKQTGTVEQYIYDFDKIIPQMDEKSEKMYLTLFINGLNTQICQLVTMQRPHSYKQAKKFALSVDASFNVLSNNKYEGRRDNYRDNKTNNYRNNNYHGNKIIITTIIITTIIIQTTNKIIIEFTINLTIKIIINTTIRKMIYITRIIIIIIKFKPKKEKECYKCGKSWAPGHFCDSKSNNFKEPKYSAFTNRCQSSLLFTPATTNGVEIERCVLDTGATQSVMSRQTINKINKNTSTFIKETGQPTKIKIANGYIVDCMFTEKFQVIFGPRVTKLSFIIMEQDTNRLQGLDWFRKTNCEVNSISGKMTFHKDDDMTTYRFIVPEDENEIETYVAEVDEKELSFASWEDEPKTSIQIHSDNLSESEKTDIINTIESYDISAGNYTKLGACTVSEHHIHTDNEKPIYVPPYRKSLREREEIKEEIIKMLDAGIIQPSRSPLSFPVVQVPKKNGTRRFCVDFRKMNIITQQDCYPLPRIDDILDRLATSRVYTTLDLKSGYWQVKGVRSQYQKQFSLHRMVTSNFYDYLLVLKMLQQNSAE
jgi:hypothetical protein